MREGGREGGRRERGRARGRSGIRSVVGTRLPVLQSADSGPHIAIQRFIELFIQHISSSLSRGFITLVLPMVCNTLLYA